MGTIEREMTMFTGHQTTSKTPQTYMKSLLCFCGLHYRFHFWENVVSLFSTHVVFFPQHLDFSTEIENQNQKNNSEGVQWVLYSMLRTQLCKHGLKTRRIRR